MSTKPTGKLKIFTGADRVLGTSAQADIFVAATSRKQAVEALNAHGVFVSAGRVASHWYCIENPESNVKASQYAPALAKPGEVFANSKMWAEDFRPLPKYDPEAEREKHLAKHAAKKASGPPL